MTAWDGALYFGPEVDNTRFYSGAMGSTPTGDFALIFVAELRGLYLGGDPSVNSGAAPGVTLGQNFAAGGSGTSGNDCYLSVYQRNGGTSGSRGHVKARLATGGVNMLASGTALEGTTVFGNGDRVVFVLQSNAGTIELKSCLAGSATVVTEATGTRNAAFTTAALGTWNFAGAHFAGYMQAALFASQALTDANIVSIAGGTDPDTIVTLGNRLKGWQFNSAAATIPALWGSTALTRNGTWAGQPVASPPIPNAATRLTVTNQPPTYGAVTPADNGAPAPWTITGTYTGYTPTALQGRIEDTAGGTVTDWTDLGSFAASAGTWTGALTVPVGGLYRLQVRDKTTPTIIWRGGNPWSVAPVHASMGQSPMAFLEQTYKNSGNATLNPTNCYVMFGGYGQVFKATAANVGPGLVAAFNQWSAASGGVPLVWCMTSVSGTSSTQWAARDAIVWPNFLAAIDYLRPKRVLLTWLNGAADAGFTAATIKANHDTIIGDLDADLGTTRGMTYRYLMLPHNRDTGNGANNHKIRGAQYEWAEAHTLYGSKVLLGPWWGDMRTNTELSGTAQAGSSNTITLVATELTSGLTAGMTVNIVAGTGAGQTATTSSYNQGTKVLTISGTWTTPPDATSVYRVVGISPHPDVIGVLTYGPRLGQDMAARFGYSRISGRGPVPAAATYPASGPGADGTVLTVTFTHRHGGHLRTPNGGRSATGLAGFQVSENNFSSTKTITSAVISGPNTVALTLSAPPTDKTQLKVRYAAAEPVPAASFDAVGGGLGDLLYDDTRVTPTGGLPAYMTLSANLAVTEAVPVTPPAGSPQAVKSLLLVNGVGLMTVAPQTAVYASPSSVGPRMSLTAATLNGPSRVQSTANGQIIEGLDLPVGAQIYVIHSNVTVRDCRVRADGGFYAVQTSNAGATGTIIEHCDLGATVHQTNLLPFGGSAPILTVRGCNIHHVVDGGRGASSSVFEDNWVHDLQVLPNGLDITHNDGWQAQGGTAMIVRRNRIEVPANANAAVFCKGDTATIDDVLIEDNYLDGGGYTLFISQNNLGVTNVLARRNVFGPNYGYARIGPRTNLTMTDNHDYTGALVT